MTLSHAVTGVDVGWGSAEPIFIRAGNVHLVVCRELVSLGIPVPEPAAPHPEFLVGRARVGKSLAGKHVNRPEDPADILRHGTSQLLAGPEPSRLHDIVTSMLGLGKVRKRVLSHATTTEQPTRQSVVVDKPHEEQAGVASMSHQVRTELSIRGVVSRDCFERRAMLWHVAGKREDGGESDGRATSIPLDDTTRHQSQEVRGDAVEREMIVIFSDPGHLGDLAVVCRGTLATAWLVNSGGGSHAVIDTMNRAEMVVVTRRSHLPVMKYRVLRLGVFFGNIVATVDAVPHIAKAVASAEIHLESKMLRLFQSLECQREFTL